MLYMRMHQNISSKYFALGRQIHGRMPSTLPGEKNNSQISARLKMGKSSNQSGRHEVKYKSVDKDKDLQFYGELYTVHLVLTDL